MDTDPQLGDAAGKGLVPPKKAIIYQEDSGEDSDCLLHMEDNWAEMANRELGLRQITRGSVWGGEHRNNSAASDAPNMPATAAEAAAAAQRHGAAASSSSSTQPPNEEGGRTTG